MDDADDEAYRLRRAQAVSHTFLRNQGGWAHQATLGVGRVWRMQILDDMARLQAGPLKVTRIQ